MERDAKKQEKAADCLQTPGKNPEHDRAEQPEVGQGAEKEARIKEQPEPAPAHIEGQQRQRQGQQNAEQRVHAARQPGPPAAGRPQQIIDEPQGAPQSTGDQELRHLQRDRQFHQPNSRDQKLPPVRWSSS